MSDNKKNQEVRENNEVWEQSGLTEEEFNALSPERKASLAEEFHKAKQAEETYNWPKVAVQVLCTTILVGGLAYCHGPQAAEFEANSADNCIRNHFNEIASDLNDIGGKFTLTYSDGSLETIVQQCEQETKTEADFFKGMATYKETIGNVTFDFK